MSLGRARLCAGSRWFIGRNDPKPYVFNVRNVEQGVCASQDTVWRLKLVGKYNVIRFHNGSTIDLLDAKYLLADPDCERLRSKEYNSGC